MRIRSAVPEQALPPGRIAFDAAAPKLLLYTVQAEVAFQKLQKEGRLVGDPRFADPDYSSAYPWIYQKMNERLSTSGDGALWLWARERRRNLVDMCRRSVGQVLLTCLVPRHRVLLSHYDDWHNVLNRWPLIEQLPGESQGEYFARCDAFDAELEAAGAKLYRNSWREDWPLAARMQVEAGWEMILDIDRYPASDSLQATVHEIRAGDVLRAVHLRASSHGTAGPTRYANR